MINVKQPLTILSYLWLTNFIILFVIKTLRSPRCNMIFFQKNKSTLLEIISAKTSTSTYLVK